MHFSFESLEFSELRQILRRYASTDFGRQQIDELRPLSDLSAIEREHQITAEAMIYLREQRVRFPDVALLPVVLEKLEVLGSMLDAEEIDAVQKFLDHIEALRGRWKDDREKFPNLAATAHRLPDLRELQKQLGRAMANGEIDERYSPELQRIRRAIATVRGRIKQKLESIVRSPQHADQLQEQLITIRNGRFVIPVRVDQKRSFEGVVHGSSSSGATVFMEPLATIEMNNELVRLEEDELREIRRILAELTDLIQKSAPEMRYAVSISAYLEATLAKAQFGRDFDCCRPSPATGNLLSLVRARHPVLEDNLRRDQVPVVPVSLDLSMDRTVLVISGPNAGGKTVVLKTVGLLALMAQSGIPVPAEEATLPVFDHILADIGDQQSITNHLSTFSAHVLALGSMIRTATRRSLILLDEIGGSTDPAEGAALAQAILEHFRAAGALVIGTTHYNRLKLYAETTSGVRNAAMEFNEVTLEPTYRLIHGLAGSSSGLKIAERFEMPSDVLSAAWKFLDSADLEAAHYVEELRRRVTDLEGQESAFEAERRQFEDWKNREVETLKEQQRQEIARIERRLDAIVREMSDKALKEFGSAREESAKKFQKKLAEVRTRAEAEIQKELRKSRPQPTIPSPEKTPSVPPRVGSTVRVPSMGVTGTVAALTEHEAELLVGNLKVRLPLDELEVIPKQGITLPKGVEFDVASKELSSTELNLVGVHVDDAISRTDKFLDDAYLAEVRTIRLVHGSGMGILRKALSDFLSGHPHVARFEFAPPQQGGRGVTVVTLRD